MNIQELKIGNDVEDLKLLLNKVDKKEKRNGGEFYILHFSDPSGSVEGRIWDSKGEKWVDKTNVLVDISGKVVEYKNNPQLKISNIKTSKNQHDLSDYIDSVIGNPEWYFKKYIKLVTENCSEDGITMISDFFGVHTYGSAPYDVTDEEKYQKVLQWSAAKEHHHSKYGGLIKHIYSMSKIAKDTVQHYNKIYQEEVFNLGKLLVGIVLHDLGKLKEITKPPGSQYRDRSDLETHITMMIEDLSLWYQRKTVEMGSPPCDESYMKDIKHMILSHHGKAEWGSPAQPSTPEAHMLHRIDMMDSRMASISEGYTQSDEDDFWDKMTSGVVYKGE